MGREESTVGRICGTGASVLSRGGERVKELWVMRVENNQQMQEEEELL